MILFLGTTMLFSSNTALAADGGNLRPQGVLLSSSLFERSKLSDKKVTKSEKKLSKDSGSKYNNLRLALGDTYYLEHRHVYSIEMERYVEKYDGCFSTPECDVTTIEADHTESQKHLDKALNMYSDFVEHASSDANVDLALMYIASIYEEKRDEPEALNTYNKILDTFPNSQWVVEAYLKSANLSFMNLKYDQAEVHKLYQKATEYPQSPLHGQALYHLAWSEYNIGNPKQAVETLSQLIELTLSKDSTQTNLLLIDTALKDGLRIAKELDSPELIKPAFEKAGSMEYYNEKVSQ